MKSSRKHRRIAKFRRVTKGVSAVVAVLLMIAIAVIASLVAYFWVMGYFRSTSTKVSKAIQVQSAYYTGQFLGVYVQNVGQGKATFIRNQCLYVDGVLQGSAHINPGALEVTAYTCQESETVSMVDKISLNLGQTIKIKVVTDEGTFVEKYFTINTFEGNNPYSLLVNVVGNGNVSRDNNGPYNYGDVVQLTASANLGWAFSGWSGDVSGSTNPTSIVVNGTNTVTATFTQNEYALTLNVVGSGSVSKLPNQATYHYGDSVKLQATGSSGWVFSGWSGDLTGSVNPTTITIDGDNTVTATFTLSTVPIAFSTSGMGADAGSATVVTIDSTPYTYADLQTLSPFSWVPGSIHSINALTPVSAGTGKQYIWTSWGAASFGTESIAENYVYTVPSSGETVTASYNTQYQIMVDASYVGAEGGTFNVTYTQNGIVYAGTYITPWREWVDNNTQVTVSNPETPIVVNGNEQYVFSSYAPSDTLTVTQASEIMLNYGAQYSVSFTQTGSAVAPTVDYQINGGSTQTGSVPFSVWVYPGDLIFYSYQAVVSGATGVQYNLTGVTPASPQVGSIGPLTIVGTYNTQYYLTVTSDYDSPSPLSGWFDSGSSITESVTSPVSGGSGTQHVCTGWSGTGSVPGSGSASSVTFTISAPSTITWSWKTQYQLTLVSAYDTPTGADWYDAGSTANFGMTNTTVSGGNGTQYVFTEWSSNDTGGYTGTSASGSVTMNNPITETASWKTQYQLTVSSVYDTPGGAGWYDIGSTAYATLSSGTVSGGTGVQYVFTGWSSDASGTGLTSDGITMNGPKTATANWKAQYQVSFAVSPSGSGSTSPSGTNVWYDAGYTINPLTATNNAGFVFSFWSTTGSISIANANSASTTATVNGTGNIMANFIRTLDHFTITGYPSSVTAGTSFSVTVTAYDSSNNVLTGYVGQVWFTSNDSQAVLPYYSGYSYTFTTGSGGDNGTHTFSGFTLKTAGSEMITVTNGTKSTTVTIPVTAVAASKLVYIAGAGQSLTVGQVSAVITVQRQDQYGNPTTSGAINVGLSTNSSGRFSSNSNGYPTISLVQIASGQSSASFYYRDSTAGTPNLTASSGSLTPATTIFTINTYQLAYTAGYSQTLAVGNVSARIRVQRQDQYGGSYSPSTQITVSLATTSLTGAFYNDSGGTQQITSVTIASGSSSSTYFYYKDMSVGSPTLSASSTGYAPATTTFTIYTPASKLVFIFGAPQTLNVGNVSGQITVQRQDQNGNPVTAGTITVTLATTSNGGVFYDDVRGRDSDETAHITISDGSSTASFYYRDYTAGSPNLTASSGSMTPATSTFTITGNNEPRYSTGINPTQVAAGSPASFTVTVTMQSTFSVDISYVTITIPSGFTGITITSVTTNNGGTWNGSLAGNVITLMSSGIYSDLEDGTNDAVQVVFTATPSTAGTYTFAVSIYGHIASDTTENYSLGPGTNTGSDPSVTVYIPVSITITSSPSGSGFVVVDGNAITTPTTFNWQQGSSHILQASSPVSGGTGVQYIFTGWSDSGAQTHNYTVPGSSATITANYGTQYNVTFSQTGLDSTASGTVVTINGASKTYSQLPNSTWGDLGTVITYSYSNVSSSTTGKRFVLTGITGYGSPITVTAPTTVTGNYATQWQVTFASNPSTGGSTTPTGTNVWESAGSLSISATPNSGYRWTSWSSTGPISINGQASSTTATISGSGTITANFVPNHLSLDGSASQSTTGNSMTVTLTTSNPNDVIYVSVVEGNSAGVTSISTNVTGLTLTSRASAQITGSRTLETWYGVWNSSGTIRIIINFDGTTSYAAAVAIGVSGANTLSPFDVAYRANTGTSNNATYTITTSNANDFIIGALGVRNAPTLTTFNGFTNALTQASGTSIETSSEYKIVSTTQTNLAAGYNLSSSQDWALIIDAIKQQS